MESQRVLVIDDDPILVEGLSTALAPPYRILTALNSPAALRLLAAEPIHLVLLDLCLGDEDGAALLPEIRKRTVAPVLLMTGFGTRENLVRSIRARPDDFIEKPFDVADLQARVARLLGRLQTLEERLERVRAKMEGEYGTRLTLGRLAKDVGMSPRELRAVFVTRFGKTPCAYLTERRMKQAARLLIGGRGLKEIAREVGYGNASNFSTAFRRHHGMTPRAYRARARGGRAAGQWSVVRGQSCRTSEP